MKIKILIGRLVFFMIMAISALAWAYGDIEVVPSTHDFGDVELGSSSTTIITVTNSGFLPLNLDVSFQAGSSSEFSFISESPLVLPSGESVDVQVTYTPSALGFSQAELAIDWTNGDTGQEVVNISGVGIDAGILPEEQITQILAFFDESVIADALEGRGHGKSALARLFVLRRMIERSGKLISRGRIRASCILLWGVYRRCDGMPQPPDFVQGEATAQLVSMIQNLRNTLGCN